MQTLQGQLLVASPHLPDPNFNHSVVLIVKHTEEGAFGVVINRPGPSKIQEIWEGICDEPCSSNRWINLGGPLEGPLMAIHDEVACSEDQIIPGLYFATQKDLLQQIVGDEDSQYRLFSGYAGWAGGQLESEMEAGGWLLTPASLEYVFQIDDEDIWHRVTRDIGHEILHDSLDLRHIPDDPTMN